MAITRIGREIDLEGTKMDPFKALGKLVAQSFTFGEA